MFWTPSIKDYTSGYVGTRKEILKAIPLQGDYGEYCIEFLYRALQKGYRILEIPYTCQPRHSGESKTATHWSGYLKRGRNYCHDRHEDFGFRDNQPEEKD